MRHIKKLNAPIEYGQLSVTEMPCGLDFAVRRFFFAKECETPTVRHGHFHKNGQQIIQGVRGVVKFYLWDGTSREDFVFEPHSPPLLIGSPIWRSYEFLKPNSMFLVLCNLNYNETMTSYNRQEFLEICNG